MYGKQTAVTAQQAYESSRRNGGAGSVLTQEQFTKAVNTGRSSKDARIQNSAARQRGEGKVYFGQDVDYGGERYKAASEDMVSSAELDVIKTLAKVTGTDVVFYQSEADMSGRYKGANGFMRNGTMYLDVNAGANRTSEESAVLLTAAHELTHYIRENNAEGYAQLRDFVTRHLIEDGADIEALAEQKAARENGLLSMDEAVEEVIADSCEMMLEDTQLPEIMAKENPGLYEQIREWIANFAEKLRKAFTGVEARHTEAKAMMQYADELSRIWDSALAGAVRNTEAATESGTTAPNNGTTAANNGTAAANNGTPAASGNARMSVREINGSKVAWIDEDITKLKPKDISMENYIREYIGNKITENGTYLATLPDSGMSVYAETKGRTPASKYGLADKYVRSTYTQWAKSNSKNAFKAKMKAAGVLDDLISIASGRKWERTKHTENKDAPYGVYNYDSTFAFPVYDNKGDIKNVRSYDCRLVILNASDGKKYLYDVTGVKENTAKANDFLLAERQRAANTAARQSGVSTSSISRDNENGNTKYSMRDVAEDDTADERRGRQESNAGFSMFAHQNRVFFVFSQRKPPLNKTRRPQGLRVISSYSSHFHVIALITRLTDREALSGKYAVFAHIIKQLVTAYAAVYEAYSVVLLCKLPHGVLTVYVIHSYSRMRCDIPIYKALQHLCFKSVNEKAAASRSAHIIHFSAAASRKLRFQSAQQIIDIRIEEHTVYRLKVHALVMYVYKLSQSILCFRGAYERRRSLCRGERMVAVSHGKKHPLPLFPAFLRKRRESGEYAPLLILGNEPAAKVPAAEHKVKIIELRELRRVYAFYYLPALIVHEDHDMRQLQRSIPADIDARRYA